MKIAYSLYELKPRAGLANLREGALLKIEFAPGQTGYADLHPLPEFGDEPVDVHLDALAEDEESDLVKRALYFAAEDATLRAQNRNAFLGLALPRAHRLVTALNLVGPDDVRAWRRAGYTHAKLKVGRDLDFEAACLAKWSAISDLEWRLDFNGRASVGDFTTWWRALPADVRERVDFVEDPCAGQLNIDGPWADDWVYQEGAGIRIIKPARENVDEVGGYPRVVFTHSLDHAFGRACALWEAARFYHDFPDLTEVTGLGEVDAFAPDAFSKAWAIDGPRLRPTTGVGFGFDDALKGLKWHPLL